MALTAGLCVCAKAALWNGGHAPGDDYRLALYDQGAVLGPFTEGYTTAGEVRGQGYDAGGGSMSQRSVKIVGARAYLGWGDVLFKNATIAAMGGLVYNASKGNAAVGVVEFGQLTSSTNGNFKVVMTDVFWIA